MSMHDVEDATRSLTSNALANIVRLNRGPVDRRLAATALLGRNQLHPVESARVILKSNEVTTDEKRAALKALGRSTDRGTEALVIESLSDPDPFVVRDAAWSLARIGTRDTMRRLQQIDPRGSETPKADVEAAQRLRAFRLGEPGFGFDKRRLPRKAAMPADTIKKMKVSTVDPELLDKGRKAIALEAAGLDLIDDRATQVICLKQPLWFLPGKVAATEPETLMQRPGVAMAIFAHNGCTGVPFLKSYVLTEPGRGGVDIFVTRLRGQPTHVGKAKVSRSGLSFEIGALATRFDPPAEIAGQLTRDGTVKLETARVSTDFAAVAKRRLKPRPSDAPNVSDTAEPRSDR